MKTVEEIQVAVRSLSDEDLAVFRDWFWEHDNDVWDRQFEADVKAGKLDELGREALRALKEGRCTDLFDGDPDRSKLNVPPVSS